MPELPDLEVFSNNLSKALPGKTFQKLGVRQRKKLKVPVSELKRTLPGQRLFAITLSGKELHLQFKNGHTLGLLLTLHGQLTLFEGARGPKYMIIDRQFDDGRHLATSDFQRAAAFTLDPEENTVPDAMNLEESYLDKIMGATCRPAKSILTDQKIRRGIGNAYALEILYHAPLSPFSAASKVPAAKIMILASSINPVLKRARKHLAKTHPGIISGQIRDLLSAHQPKKDKTPSGRTIGQKPVGSSKTYYTDEQELFD